MIATVYTTGGGTRFHFDRACTALANGREFHALRAGVGALSGLYRLRTRSNLGAALLGFTACRVCVPTALALPATGQTYGHEPVLGIGWFGEDETICVRCTERGLYWGSADILRPVHVVWPCTSAVVLGLAARGGA
jgi:hypothetical protein